jgi:hypothetical protein
MPRKGNTIHRVLEPRAIVTVTRAHIYAQRQSMAVANQMELGTISSS